MGICKHVQYRNSAKIPKQSISYYSNAPWYDPNKQLNTDLGISPVREEITNISHKYKDKLTAHPNELATTLLNDEVEPGRLKRFKPADLIEQHI
jgi:hypothetical protein